MNRGSILLTFLLCVVAACSALAFTVLFDKVDHLVLGILVPVMFLLGVIPIAVSIVRGTFDLFEIRNVYFGMFFLFYGLSAFLVLWVHGITYDAGVIQYLDVAVAVLTLGFGCMQFGYALAGRFIRPMMTPPTVQPGAVTILLIYGIGFAGTVVNAIRGHAPMQLGATISGVTSLLTQLSFLSTFATFYVLFRVMNGSATKGIRLAFYAVVLPTQLLSVFLYVGNKSVFLFAVGLPIIAYWYAKRKILWKTIVAVALVLMFVVFPVYYKYRTIKGPYVSHQNRVVQSFEDIAGESRGSTFTEDVVRMVSARLALVNSTAVIIRETGRTVDYQLGSTIWLGVVAVAIPRIIWEDKPTTNIGTEFGKTFRITRALDYSAVALSIVGELYWNFHVPGVIVGMFLLGICMRAIYLRFGANMGANALRLSMYVTLVVTFYYDAEGSISGLEGSLIKQIALMLLLEKGLALVASIGERRALPGGVDSAPVPLG